MRSFPGKIHFVEAETDDLLAVISIDDTRLQISTDDTPIGEWPITDIELELGTRGYHVTLDGEEVVLAPHDRFGFNEAVEVARQTNGQSARQRRKAEKKKAKEEARRAKTAAPESPPVPAPAAPQPEPADTEQKPKRRRQRSRADEPAPPEAPPEKPAAPPEPPKPKTERTRWWNRSRPDPDAPKPVPHVPGLEDPDKDALWATHRTQEPGSWREWLNTSEGGRKIAIVGGVVFLVLVFFAPAVVALMFLIPGVAAVILAGLSMLDPAYARFVPGAMTEVRLMVVGIGFFAASLIIAWIF